MPVTFRCSECTQKLRIEDSFAGKLVSCVRCGAKQRVPLETSPEFAKPKPKPAAEEQQPPQRVEPPASPPVKGEPAEVHGPKPFKPWQPRPLREEPLPSEKPKAEVPKRGTPPGELSFDSLSAIFDEPIASETPEVKEEVREESRGEFHEEGHPPVEPAAEAVVDEQEADEELDDEAPAYSSPEFEAGPLVAAGSKHFEAVQVPAHADLPEPRHAPATHHAEPSMVPPAKKLDVEELIDMTAMVDIVFFLLIFFLVTSMHTLDSTIPMPTPDPQKGAAKEPQTVAAIDADDSYVVVRIDKNDKITVEGAEVRSERDLLFKLRDLRLAASRPEKLLVIGHGDATHGTAVMILDAGRELGMDQVKLTVQDEEE